MLGRKFGFLLPALILSAAMPQRASAEVPSVPGAPPLDYLAIRTHYDNGDFDRVAQNLESFVARNPTHSHDDSVFVAKHLAVVYSSNDATAEKGRQYMYRLLDLLPSSRLVDMYVQDERSRIFRKVREQFMARQHAMGVDTARIVLPDSRMPVATAATGPKADPALMASVMPMTSPEPMAAAAPLANAEPMAYGSGPGPGVDSPPRSGASDAGRYGESHPAPIAAHSRTRPAPSGFRTPKPRSARRGSLEEAETQGSHSPLASGVETPGRKRKASKTSYLFAGGAAFVAAAAVTYFVLSDSPGSTEKTYVVP